MNKMHIFSIMITCGTIMVFTGCDWCSCCRVKEKKEVEVQQHQVETVAPKMSQPQIPQAKSPKGIEHPIAMHEHPTADHPMPTHRLQHAPLAPELPEPKRVEDMPEETEHAKAPEPKMVLPEPTIMPEPKATVPVLPEPKTTFMPKAPRPELPAPKDLQAPKEK